jgi:hypothetical protein
VTAIQRAGTPTEAGFRSIQQHASSVQGQVGLPAADSVYLQGQCGKLGVSLTTMSTVEATTPSVAITTAAPGTVTSLPSTTAAPVDTNIRVYSDCKSPTVEPTEIVLACADLGAVLERLSWTSWTSTKATAVGTLVYNDCTPDCARGQRHSVSGTKVTLSTPVRGAQGQLVYSEVQESPQPPGYATGPYHGGPQPLPTQPD